MIEGWWTTYAFSALTLFVGLIVVLMLRERRRRQREKDKEDLMLLALRGKTDKHRERLTVEDLEKTFQKKG